MSTAELRAVFLERMDALHALTNSGDDIPVETLARQCRLVAWAKRDWKQAVQRDRKESEHA